MKNIKLAIIWICLKISVNLVFKVTFDLTGDGINIDFKLRNWCGNAI